MDRRTLLKTVAAAAAGVAAGPVIAAGPRQLLFGWEPDHVSLGQYITRTHKPFLKQSNARIKDSGKGKKAFLHRALETVTKSKYVPHDQKAPDCVGQAFALGVDMLSAVQIALKRFPEWWIAKAAVEPIYGGSRNEIGGGLRGAGSRGHWAAEWLVRYGVLLRKQYPGGYDFTVYSGDKSNEMGREGVPDDLEPFCKLHPVKKVAICTSYADLCDCLYNGSPVVVCSNVGFGNTNRKLYRDKEGFLEESRWYSWYHAMLFAGYDDTYSRPGALCFNSWGEEYIAGPTREQPPSTFWIDAGTVDKMLEQGDSFALSSYIGFPRINVPSYILH